MSYNNFVCIQCKRNITNEELVSSNIVRTRYNDRIHTFCPTCDNHIVSINSDLYDKNIKNLANMLIKLGCKLICYYEGEVIDGTNSIEFFPPIFRIADIEDMSFYNIACHIKKVNESILEDFTIIDEGDGTFSIIGGIETWYFDSDLANSNLRKNLILLKRIINMLICYGNKQQKMGEH